MNVEHCGLSLELPMTWFWGSKKSLTFAVQCTVLYVEVRVSARCDSFLLWLGKRLPLLRSANIFLEYKK